ncbi:hypothetical protein EVAR_53364_1 [Eumeta japonica]|uniref:Uncharacterized protein n=1 Tax=Eumeta variegata TaxID=151549 RepID=A0A4C1Y846_EUMVA|nr:hypothetical protein EVAR_53364_1 [Eumeta japonica]
MKSSETVKRSCDAVLLNRIRIKISDNNIAIVPSDRVEAIPHPRTAVVATPNPAETLTASRRSECVARIHNPVAVDTRGVTQYVRGARRGALRLRSRLPVYTVRLFTLL